MTRGTGARPLRRWSPRAAYAVIGVLAAFFVASWYYGLSELICADEVDGPRMGAATHAHLQVMAARFGLQQATAEGGGPAADPMWRAFDRADRNLGALLDGGTPEGEAILRLDDSALRDMTIRARNMLMEYRALAEQRLDPSAMTFPDPRLAARLEAAYSGLVGTTAGLQEALQASLHQRLAGLRWVMAVLLAVGIIVTGAVAGVAWRLERRKRVYRITLEEEIVGRSKAERALQKSKAYLDIVVQQMPIVVWTTDADLHITSSQGAGLERLNLQAGETTGRTLYEAVGSDDPAYPPNDASLRALKGEHANYVMEFGGTVWDTFIEPLRDADGTIVGTIGITLDVTERHQAEVALEQREEELRKVRRLDAIGTLAGGVAHDFNNLLAAIMTCAETIRMKTPKEDPRYPIVAQILETGQRGTGVVKNLLRFALREPVSSQVVRSESLVGEILTLARSTFDRRIQVVEHVEPDLWPIRCDPSQIHQMLMNLCINARDALMDAGGGVLAITAGNVMVAPEMVPARSKATPGPFLRVEVRDDGGGIPDSIIDRIFEPFFTTKAPGKGSGLGLSTAYGIADGHGGFVLVDTREGGGTAFGVYLPAVHTEGEPEAEERPVTVHAVPGGDGNQGPNGGRTILMADDEAVLRAVLAEHLADCGYKVLTAADGEDALTQVAGAGERLDLLLLNLTMPKMSGWTVLRRVRQDWPELPVIVMSGHAEATFSPEEKALYTTYLQKPCTLGSLTAEIERVLGHVSAI